MPLDTPTRPLPTSPTKLFFGNNQSEQQVWDDITSNTYSLRCRKQPKDEQSALQLPMVEVAGAGGGAMLVFRPWTVSDVKEAMQNLPSLQGNGEQFGEELMVFCKAFPPCLSCRDC
ncbi:hypothetical protein LDENG_00244550 [Lucifuga dentata]|nr:hypothetical protein LDENG_00244550 [Lucifuga dentata]